MRVVAAVTGCLLALAACGDESVVSPAVVPQASDDCDAAFAAAAETTDLSRDTAADVDALFHTLSACGSFDDWLAGARTYREVLPPDIDRETTLDMLCRDAGDVPACEGWDRRGEPAA